MPQKDYAVNDKPINIDSPLDLEQVWTPEEVNEFIDQNILNNWNQANLSTYADERLQERHSMTTTTTTMALPFYCTVCSNTDDYSTTSPSKINYIFIQHPLSTSLYYIFSYTICWNIDEKQEIQIACNIRIILRFILSKFRYYLSVYYIIDFLKARNAQIYQVKLHSNQTFALLKDTW